jgi:hypothetical protein
VAVEDPTEVLKQALERAQSVKFGRGVVGKTGHVCLGVVVIWAIITARLGSDILTSSALVGAGLIATGFGAWWIRSVQSFAEKNPAQAMLEGAEFLEYQRLGIEAKGMGSQTGRLVEDRGNRLSDK